MVYLLFLILSSLSVTIAMISFPFTNVGTNSANCVMNSSCKIETSFRELKLGKELWDMKQILCSKTGVERDKSPPIERWCRKREAEVPQISLE